MSPEDWTPGEPKGAEETLRRLEERLDRASAAAERLMAEATHAAGEALTGSADAGAAGAADAGVANPGTARSGSDAGSDLPPAGWQAPDADADPRRQSDLEAVLVLVRSLRDLIPPELQQRLINAVREVLQALRDLLDWYLERLDRKRAEPEQVQDIPIF